jgi:hypothetical protein
MIPLRLSEAIHVISHHAGGTLEAHRRSIPQPVDALQSRPVPKMKARDRVERFLALLDMEKIVGAQRSELALQLGRSLSVLEPARGL